MNLALASLHLKFRFTRGPISTLSALKAKLKGEIKPGKVPNISSYDGPDMKTLKFLNKQGCQDFK